MGENNSFPKSVPQNVTYNQQFVHSVAPAAHINPVQLEPKSQTLFCPSCHAIIQTELRYETSSKTHLMALLLGCLFWPVACLPYCIDSCHDANHYCPNCGTYIGTFCN